MQPLKFEKPHFEVNVRGFAKHQKLKLPQLTLSLKPDPNLKSIWLSQSTSSLKNI